MSTTLVAFDGWLDETMALFDVDEGGDVLSVESFVIEETIGTCAGVCDDVGFGTGIVTVGDPSGFLDETLLDKFGTEVTVCEVDTFISSVVQNASYFLQSSMFLLLLA